jgi:rhodanese-related sulfurtransferase
VLSAPLIPLILKWDQAKIKNMFGRHCSLLLIILLSLTARAQHPFKYDNTGYQPVYLNDAFNMMDTMHQFLLLDVRTPGEYADTARATALNIGRIRGAVNIPVDSVTAHLTELSKFKDQPIFIYCSHSQRSRRVSKLLIENGFQKIYNINGGMTLVNEYDDKQFVYKNKMLETHTNYKNIAGLDALHLIQDNPDLLIIDIRTEKEFTGMDSSLQNNIGYLKNAINIPQSLFAEKIDAFHFSNSRPVLLYDQKGFNSMDVVEILRAKGFTRIYNLFEGLEAFICDHDLTENKKNPWVSDAPSWYLLDPKACIDLLAATPDLVILDTRPDDEFNNQSKTTYRNLGRMKGALPLSSVEGLSPILLGKDRSVPFLVYGWNTELAFQTCQELGKKGYRQVYLLSQGFYHFVWSTANVSDCAGGKAFLVNHDGLY